MLLSRRFSNDYERLPETAEAMIYGAMSRLCCAGGRGQRERDENVTYILTGDLTYSELLKERPSATRAFSDKRSAVSSLLCQPLMARRVYGLNPYARRCRT